MTDNPNDLDMDQIPEGEVMEEDAPQARKATIPPGVKLTGLAVVALVGLGSAIFYTSAQQEAASQAPRVASLDSTPGGAVQQESEVYRESVSALNEQRANRASELGATSVPTPEAILRPLEEPITIDEVDVAEEKVEEPEPQVRRPVVAERRVLPRPAPAPEVTPVRQRVEVEAPVKQPVAPPKSSSPEEENPYIALIGSQMASMSRSFAPQEMAHGTVSHEAEGDEADQPPADEIGDAQDAVDEAPLATELLLRPGDVLYAETLTSVSSDMDSPVLAEIVSGEFKGARLTGSFTTDQSSDRMVVNFSNMTLADGRVFSVSAFAVDGATAETAVASDVKRRYVARYGPIIAAAFISGYAQSRLKPPRRLLARGMMPLSPPKLRQLSQSLYAGAASAASAVSSDIMANAVQGPEIILRDGYPIGIIFVEGVADVAQ